MQRALALAFRARLDFPRRNILLLKKANERKEKERKRNLSERKILSPRKNKLSRNSFTLSSLLFLPLLPCFQLELSRPPLSSSTLFSTTTSSFPLSSWPQCKNCSTAAPLSPLHRRYKTCKIEKTPAFQCLYYMYTRAYTWARRV